MDRRVTSAAATLAPSTRDASLDLGMHQPGSSLLARAFKRRSLARAWIVPGLLVLVLGALTLYPLAMLLYGSVHSSPPGSPGVFDLNGYRQVFNAKSLPVLTNTLSIAFTKTVLSLIVATALAWIIARTDTPYRRTLELLITLPFFIPPILTAMAWGMLGNPQVGLLNQIWEGLTGSEQPLFNVYSYAGVVWHMMQYSVPFLFLLFVEAFRAMDPTLEESSRMSGASPFATFRRITLVLMLPALTSGAILSFIRGIESFESALFFGTPAGIRMVTTEIYDSINQRATPEYEYATALSFVVMAVMALLVVLQWRTLRGRSFQTIVGKGFAPRLVRLGKLRWLTFAFCMAFFVISVVLPIAQLVLGSMFKFIGFYNLDSLTFAHYRAAWENDELWRALRNTLALGVGGASLTLCLGAVVAYVSVRTRWPGRRLLEFLAWLPWLMPGIVLAVGYLWAFAAIPGPIQLYGTIWALLLAYIALGTPLSVRVMSTAWMQLSHDLEESSRVHGANWTQTFWRILIAIAWPSFAVGWILVFFGILRELSASILLYSVGTEVLSVEVLKLWSNGDAEQVCVVGLFMIALAMGFRALQALVFKRAILT
ncbi:MAG: iron ABC transporter permease [Burkholderiaceae bacterium]|jgi:iron(III) transport system permease protein